uniref:Uncharacterized protein n=1 Tax=Chromera velia CCMP2878 TaxID=1169474 RepID=A0A0G4I4P2_9ALVE|eukprot:Cvel_10933.t1-p1 / transcript=Cvel_10933.t1 / gene=Cvel_10933 / organism=Chromera_velia_CCMP2878 / gene_product=hypothetical protein / transcript_product=hypothetical protein / location=Cvel_scaffold672:43304-43588(-) / protein_length=95 / sequence_SO=supercontig / SO=protein_coding / is_pseudo=false
MQPMFTTAAAAAKSAIQSDSLLSYEEKQEEKEEGGEVHRERGSAALRLREAHPIKKCKKEEVEEKEPEAPPSVMVPARAFTGSLESVVCTYDMVQ